MNGEWTLTPGQTLYLKKGAEVIHQYFDDEYCMLGFFLSDDLIKETYNEIKGTQVLQSDRNLNDLTAFEVQPSDFLENYFHSMLTYFKGQNRPPDPILILKVKELLLTLMNSDPMIASYFTILSNHDKPSIHQIMENNFCFNLKMEEFAELAHRSLSTFKRDFQAHFKETPGKWLLKRRVHHAAHLIANTKMNMTQVAFESGFEDLSHFSRSFKNIMGVNPTDYKKG